MNESKTPRTDAVSIYGKFQNGAGQEFSSLAVPEPFARTLEFELAEAKNRIISLELESQAMGDATNVIQSERDTLRAELARLQQSQMPEQTQACSKCGTPGAVLHFPGGYLCQGGCELNSTNDQAIAASVSFKK